MLVNPIRTLPLLNVEAPNPIATPIPTTTFWSQRMQPCTSAWMLILCDSKDYKCSSLDERDQLVNDQYCPFFGAAYVP